MKYKLAVCGGTFDLLHKGHKKFLSQILQDSEKLIIGLTSDNYTRENKEVFEDFKTRKTNLEEFLTSIKASGRSEIVPIDDVYGPLLDKELQADVLFVTSVTSNGGKEINAKRESLGLPVIKIELLNMEKSEDGELISSSRIRDGEINRDGNLYINQSWVKRRLILPQNLREELTKPFGIVLKEIPADLKFEKLVTIGDETSKRFNEMNTNQKLSIVDFIVKRERKFDKLEDLGFKERIETQIVENPAGEISWDLFEVIKKSLNYDRSVVLVNGEEDLAVLPAVLIAPLGFKIYYGQPNEGLVEVVVTEAKKEEAYHLVSKFELSQSSFVE